jgi:hypothetical protein
MGSHPASVLSCSACGRGSVFVFFACARGCAASVLLIRMKRMPARPLFPRVVRVVSQDGSTPLLVASSKGHLEVVERLIAAKAMVDAACKVALRICHSTLPPIHTSQHVRATSAERTNPAARLIGSASPVSNKLLPDTTEEVVCVFCLRHSTRCQFRSHGRKGLRF